MIEKYKNMIEILLMTSKDPITEEFIFEKFGKIDIREIIQSLNKDYEERSIFIVEYNNSWVIRTKEDCIDLCRKLITPEIKFSKATLETLTSIAYFQPVTRPEIERIRGVSLAKGTMDMLLQNNFIKPLGRRQSPGNPLLFGTTDYFLQYFDLTNINELSLLEDMKNEGMLDLLKDANMPSFFEESEE